MKKYSKYLIGATDIFDPAAYPSLTEEITMINNKTQAVPGHFKADIIVSFLKDHSIQTSWVASNPHLARLVASKELFSGTIESLFESCKDNPGFVENLELYLKERLSGVSAL